MDESESGRIQCMESGCGRIVGEKMVEALVDDKVKKRQVPVFLVLCRC